MHRPTRCPVLIYGIMWYQVQHRRVQFPVSIRVFGTRCLLLTYGVWCYKDVPKKRRSFSYEVHRSPTSAYAHATRRTVLTSPMALSAYALVTRCQ
eukprot:2767724-Rhodomonas_salina.7